MCIYIYIYIYTLYVDTMSRRWPGQSFLYTRHMYTRQTCIHIISILTVAIYSNTGILYYEYAGQVVGLESRLYIYIYIHILFLLFILLFYLLSFYFFSLSLYIYICVYIYIYIYIYMYACMCVCIHIYIYI